MKKLTSKTNARVEEAINDIRQGRMVILFDHTDRENEGDLIVSAEKVTPQIINFMAKQARGLICLAMQEKPLERLNVPMMPERRNPNCHRKTAFTASIEAAKGVTTGISAADRTRTIKVAINPKSTPADIVMPGHIFPVRAEEGGVLKRAGHTEGSVDLAMLAGLNPSAVMCEIMNDDGTMARMPDLKRFAKKHKLKLISIAELIEYRKAMQTSVTEISSAHLPLKARGKFTIKIFGSEGKSEHSVVLIRGRVNSKKPTLVRLHSECFTGDIFGSLRCDCGWQLQTALTRIDQEGGVLLYLRQEGRGIGLVNKIKAYHLQDQGQDTVEANHSLGFSADQRDYGIAAQILHHLGVEKIRLLTNNPNKIKQLKKYGFDTVTREPITMDPTPENYHYLCVKRDKLGHWLQF